MSRALPRMYDQLAEWWPLLSPPSEYEDEAADLLGRLPATRPATLLELGAGGGSLAFHLKRHFRMTLSDRSPAMLRVSQAINPECEHLLGDMRSLRLSRLFDIVLVHDAIMYATDPAAVRATLRTAAVHCRVGGTVAVLPDYIRETFAPGIDDGGHDAADGRGLRYLEWRQDPRSSVFESRKRSPEHERSSLKRVYTTVLLALLLVAGCRTGRNYPSTEGPRYAGGRSAQPSSDSAGAAMLRVVSFNVEFAQQVDSAIALLSSDPALRDADLLLLQEMNEDATRRVAEALGMWYVYYPAIYHLRTKRHFGNAVLSRWPIVEDKKILLPHHSRFARTQRTATAATIRAGNTLVRVYSTHLGTMTDVVPASRRDQLQAILTDAKRYPHVILGGDMNDTSVGGVALEHGYRWPTRRGPDTSWLGRLDHIFFKGLMSPDSAAAGTVLDVRSASDHLPVWAVVILPYVHR